MNWTLQLEEHYELNVGLLGELQVNQRLVEKGWHPVRLDTAQMAVNHRDRVLIQVKTTLGEDHSHTGHLGLNRPPFFVQRYKLQNSTSEESNLPEYNHPKIFENTTTERPSDF